MQRKPSSALRQIIIPALLLITLGSCMNKFCRGDIPPQIRTVLEIKRGGKNVTDSELRTAYLFWMENGIKTIDSNRDIYNPTTGVTYPQISADKVDSTKPLFYSFLIGNTSARGVKDYYIVYANGTIDTVTIDYKANSSKEGHCTYTSIVLNEIKYRGSNASIDSSLTNDYQRTPVYIINK